MSELEFDMDLFLRLCEEVGATVTEGEGGVYVNGRKVTAEEIFRTALGDEDVTE